jgi:hypothetical protein
MLASTTRTWIVTPGDYSGTVGPFRTRAEYTESETMHGDYQLVGQPFVRFTKGEYTVTPPMRCCMQIGSRAGKRA